MDGRFDEAIQIVLKNEGGFSNNPRDPGGATMFGISLRFLQENDIHIVDKETIGLADILAINLNKAKEIYYDYFWLKTIIYRIPNLQIATKTLDASVNLGPQTAIKLLQQSINSCQTKTIRTDGIIGEETLVALNNYNILTCKLINDYRVSLTEHYEHLVTNNPSLSIFKNGWLRRASQ